MANSPLTARDSGESGSLVSPLVSHLVSPLVSASPLVLALPGVSFALCGGLLTGTTLGGSPRAILYCSTGSNSFLIESVLAVVIGTK